MQTNLVGYLSNDETNQPMNELFQAAFALANLPFTVLLILILIYWASVIFGALDFGSLDLEFDLDADADTDVDVDGTSAGWFAELLHFFNFGKLPFMVVMSFIILFTWIISVCANHYFGGDSLTFATALFFPNLFVRLSLTKLVSSPLVPFFQSLDVKEEPVDYIGLSCTITLPATKDRMGQAQVIIDDIPLLINIKLSKDTLELKKGTEALIVGKEADNACFFIQSEKS